MKRRPLRLFSIDLAARGFGFVLLDAKLGLLDWGFSNVSADDDETFMARIREKVKRNAPTALVLENFAPVKEKATALRRLGLLIELAHEQRIGTCQVSRKVVEGVLGMRTKDEIAKALAFRFPVLQSRVPPERERWMDEDDRMHIFDALSFAVAISYPFLGVPLRS
jgi:hypothetical protein